MTMLLSTARYVAKGRAMAEPISARSRRLSNDVGCVDSGHMALDRANLSRASDLNIAGEAERKARVADVATELTYGRRPEARAHVIAAWHWGGALGQRS